MDRYGNKATTAPSSFSSTDPASLTLDDIKVLEQARQRIYQLTTSIQRLQQEVYQQNPLPSWSSFQKSSSILTSNVQSLAEHLDRHSQLLNRIAVHPSTNYPGRTQEDLLGVLLRKKLEPQVQTWVEEGREIASGEAAVTNQDQEMWSFASNFMNERVQKYALEEAGANYTTAEKEEGVENVRTGLRRKLDDDDDGSDEDEEDEDEDEEMENAVVPAKTTPAQITIDPREEAKQRQADMLSMMRLATSGNPPLSRPGQQSAR